MRRRGGRVRKEGRGEGKAWERKDRKERGGEGERREKRKWKMGGGC